MNDYNPDNHFDPDEQTPDYNYMPPTPPGAVPPPVYLNNENPADPVPGYYGAPATPSPEDYIHGRNDDDTGYTRAFTGLSGRGPEAERNSRFENREYMPPAGQPEPVPGYEPLPPYGSVPGYEPLPDGTGMYYEGGDKNSAVPGTEPPFGPEDGIPAAGPAFSDTAGQAPYDANDYINNRADVADPFEGDDGEQYYEDEEAEEYSEEEERRRIKREKSLFKKRRRKPSFALAVIIHSMRLLLLIILLLGLSGIGAVVGIARAYVDSAPELDLAALDNQAQTTVIRDSGGNKICDYKGTENRIMISIDRMPQYLRDAFVAVEDARFYEHNGIDIKRIAGAFFANFTTGSNQGGSTITQQLIKNTLLSPEQSYKRKIQEAYLAMQLETKYTKEQILECYLNTIYLGEDYYGVQTAAYGYFGKEDLSQLTLRECAILAGITRSPSYYNPRRNFYTRVSEQTDYAAITNNRADYVLLCMYENGFISYEEYQEALNPETAHVLSASPEGNDLYQYPHYVEYAIRDVIQTLLKMKGLENTAANRSKMDRELRTGGYEVYLAVDPEIQKIVEETLENYSYPDMRDPSDKVYRARNSDGTYTEIPQPQAAAVVMDYRTGEVKAIVGSRTHPTQRKTLNRATDMNMPVGSSIKPIGVYAPAIELGRGPASVAYNMPLPLKGWKNDEGQDAWPKNYGGSEYRGPETLRTALKYSDNTAAAYTLLTYSSVDISVDFLRRLGVSDEHINATPFGLSLGSSGITPFEMAAAYSSLGNSGKYLTPITFLMITKKDENGNSMVVCDNKRQQTERQVFSPSTAWLVIDMMKDAVAEGTGTPAKIKGQTVAGKTGTNSDQKGVFFVGLTGWYCGAVWVGHDNYKSLSSKATGGKTAGALWKAFMSEIHTKKGLSNRDIYEGSASDYGLIKVTTCVVSGQLATDACRHDGMGYGMVTDYWRAGTEPTEYCQLHQTVTVCNDTGMLASSTCTNVSEKSMLILPYGHPLTKYQGTEYEGVLTDYLGNSARYRIMDNGVPVDTCPGHTQSGWPSYDGPVQSSGVQNNARALLGSAGSRLTAMDPSSPAYYNLYQAAENLRWLLEAGASDAQLIEAMGYLSQAMAESY